MSKAIITLEDTQDGLMTVGADFGDRIEDTSQAHQMAQVLLNSILTNAKRYETIEDTAPEHNVEPSLIITPENASGL